MAKTAMGFGIAHILLGVLGFMGTGSTESAVIIPGILGLALLLLGYAALDEKYLKRATQAAAVLTLLGFLGSGMRVLAGINEKSKPDDLIILTSQLVMAILCAVFAGLAVKFFFESSKQRSQK